jgi:hypothetical protein
MGCQNANSKNAYNFFYKIPIVHLNGKLDNIADSFTIISHNGVMVYRFPYTQSMEDIENKIQIERKYRYFVFKDHEKNGYIFTPSNSINILEVNVDSTLKSLAFSGTNYFDSENDKLTETVVIGGSYKYSEKYIPKLKYDYSYPDTTIFYFSEELKGLEFSFSEELEKKVNQKIGMVNMIHKEYYDSVHQIQIPLRKFEFRVKRDYNFKDSALTPILNKYDQLRKQR